MRVCPTVREPDGLAMSSRNRYLSPLQRQQSLVLWESLNLAQALVRQGQRSVPAIVRSMCDVIARVPEAKIDYVALADPDTLEAVTTVEHRAVALLAVRIGATRLIDNVIIEVN
jgi:pantoate--beta-alanine ligase